MSRWLVFFLLVLACTALAEPLPEGQQLAWESYRIFQNHCAECHGAHLKKPKGGFGSVLDLAAMSANPDYVVPGAPERSEIYLSITDADPETRMPPPESDAPPLAPEQIDTVRQWIAGGAGLGGEAPAAAVPVVEVKEARSLRELFARLHPLVVHFPIGLLIAACGASGLWLAHPRFHWLEGAVRWSLWIGLAGAVVAAGSGWLDAGVAGYADHAVFYHRWLGVATASLALVATGLFELSHGMRARRRALLVFCILLVTLVVVTLAAHTGGLLVHGADYLW